MYCLIYQSSSFNSKLLDNADEVLKIQYLIKGEWQKGYRLVGDLVLSDAMIALKNLPLSDS